ncbi:receptor-like protein kinase [Musa troglodytarum]|uniref:Receptor-like protein kinase n=1 Tax=Musa troglodytarum TaxID=320322 RepID=A0A9E7H527_9LILI|nr:receptor-like protein kinase [Musa troglodytarum]
MFPANVSSSSLFPLLGFVLLILCHSSLTGAQNLDQICDASGSFADNSTYQSNLKLYLSSLPSKGSVSGFLKETVGEVPDQVYGVSLCRGDVNASECRACLNKASLDVQQICPYNKGAMIYYDYCLLRFSNQNFLSSTDNQQVPKYNSSSVTQVVRLSQLLHLLLSSATDWAANSTKRFATGEMSNFTSEFPTIYVMVECTPDLSPSDCSQCLQSLFDPLPTDMVGRQGARVIGVRCVMRYELSSFSKVPSMLKLTAPLEDATQLRSAGKKKNAATTALAIAIPAFTALLILSLIYICYWRTRKRIIQSAYETVPELITGVESLLFDLSTLRLATANFSEENKLGEGDPERSEQLRWGTRYRIIRGIAQGLLYLHEESQLKIIHRDLKTSMNPKISDFGIAKLFDADQTQDTTKRVVGTFGYMAPEYVKHGKFSVRSDVFSFGILVLEILTGRKNSKSYNSEYSESLLSYTWEKWRCGSILEMVDPALDGHCQGSDLLRCMQIGLLCVQENPNDRPTMSTVVTMLNSGIAFLQAPGRPAFYVEQEDVNVKITANDATIAIDVCDGESKPLPASSTQSIIAMFPVIVSSSSLLPLLGFVLLILCHSSLTGAQNLDQICDASGSFADNSTYQSNLKLYLSSLPSKGSVSGFLKETVGEVPDQVYGVSLCRGDVNASECRACLNKASLDVQQICPYNKGAMIYYDYCLLRFSNQNFLSSTNNQQVPKYNSSSVTQVVRLSQLLHLLLSSATDWAANSTKRFATGEMSNFTSEFPTIYVMVECTPDLSPSDCSQCLQSLFDPLPTDMVGKQGARVIGVRCCFRYELSSFSKVPSMVKLTAPMEDATQLPSDGSAGKKKNAATTALAIAIPAFTALLILSLIYICYWRTRKRIIQSAYETVPELITGVESLLFDLSTLRLATANFSEENKLGEGDPERSEQLRWGTRYRIIRGIAQGLLYLHEESQLKIIHRDLKASMNPKISDFGIAKLFDADQTQDTTKRVVGTFGYMAPEYVKHGKFSVRSDVFSFGILVLEILTGRKNSKSYNSEHSESLLSYTWEKWRCGSILEMVDPALDGHYQGSDLLRCMQIGLLCVQENPNDRPTMSTVVTMLNSGIAFLQAPGRPAFYVEQEDVNVKITANDATIAIDVCDGESMPLPASSTQVSISEQAPR